MRIFYTYFLLFVNNPINLLTNVEENLNYGSILNGLVVRACCVQRGSFRKIGNTMLSRMFDQNLKCI